MIGIPTKSHPHKDYAAQSEIERLYCNEVPDPTLGLDDNSESRIRPGRRDALQPRLYWLGLSNIVSDQAPDIDRVSRIRLKCYEIIARRNPAKLIEL